MRSVRGGVGECRSYQCREEGGRRANEGRAMFEEEERKKKSSDLLLDFLQVSGG